MADGAPNRDARTEFLDIEVTREPEAYLRRGRIHANLPDGELNSLWEAAFVAWFRSRGAQDRLGYYDLDIELELRGLEPPIEVVHAELARAHAKLLVNTDDESPALNERPLVFLKAANDTEPAL